MDWFGLHEVPSANTQKWISALASAEDQFLSVCRDLPDPHRQEWLLLACALHQSIGLQALSELLTRSIEAFCSFSSSTALTETAPRDIWRACGEIHFMGRSSSVRPKALAFLHRLQAPFPAGLGISLKNEGGSPPLPASGGARRWLAWIGPWESSGYSNASPARKQQILDGLYRRLNPDAPWLACHSLQFFTEAAFNSYYCSRIVGGCAQCHLAADCPRRLS